MSPSKIATLAVFSLNSMEFLTFNQMFTFVVTKRMHIIFGFLGALPQTPPGALCPDGDGTHSFVPSETNSWLRPCVIT